ncbi:putative pentatricopeptide repeat-containing protein [Cocos nucifera]|uniref:Putative pentatricopeptide repeat-containing protein n=1 Tax=Cocos nucifera TaxID=13894 RepID=A0A8K0IFE7_COCNU|nr:putative pentatricopeptide repeat-containing protein [Cocos nucifera]
MYGRCCPDLTDAHRLFDEVPHRNCFSWNLLIDASLKSGDPAVALKLFDLCLKETSSHGTPSSPASVRYGDLENARRLFEETPARNVVACNAIINGYVRPKCEEDVLGSGRWGGRSTASRGC